MEKNDTPCLLLEDIGPLAGPNSKLHNCDGAGVQGDLPCYCDNSKTCKDRTHGFNSYFHRHIAECCENSWMADKGTSHYQQPSSLYRRRKYECDILSLKTCVGGRKYCCDLQEEYNRRADTRAGLTPSPGHKPEKQVESINEFMGSITASFIRFIFEDDTPLIRRIVWIIFWLVCCGYALSNIQSAVAQFFAYETASQLSFTQTKETGIAMPAITICNMNKYRKSWLTATDSKYSVVLKYEQERVWGESDITAEDDELAKKLKVDEVENAGKHDLQDMFKEITFDGADLMDCDDWTDVFLAQYTELGVCFTFNADGKRKVKRTGNDYGATFTININQTEYADTQESAGIKVMLHDFRERPLIKEYGLAIPPGSEAFISTRTVEQYNIGVPYANSNCTKRPLRSSRHYSVTGCNLECYAEILEAACGCRPAHMPVDEIPMCDLYTHRTCVEVETAKIHKGVYATQVESCWCIDACNSTGYEYSLSRGEYPSLNAARNIIRTFNGTMSIEELRDNYTRLHVYFETIAIQQVRKVASYTTMNLLGDVGGNLGLFIGANVATLAEVLDYLFRWCHVLCLGLHKKQRK